MTDQQHLDHLRSFFQVPQRKRRRRLLLVFIPSLMLAGVLGALVGLKDAVWELWDEWKHAWNIPDTDPNWRTDFITMAESQSNEQFMESESRRLYGEQ